MANHWYQMAVMHPKDKKKGWSGKKGTNRMPDEMVRQIKTDLLTMTCRDVANKFNKGYMIIYNIKVGINYDDINI